MKIIKAEKFGKSHVKILFDDSNQITLAYEIFLKHQLKLKQGISQAVLSQIVREDQEYSVRQSALGYIARRHHSKNEIRIKLKQKKFDGELIEQTLDQLEQKKYIDDNSFARAFTDEKIKTRNWGRIKIKSELIKRGISTNIIEEIIQEKFSGESEIEAGLELAAKKLRKIKNRKFESDKVKSNIFSFLISRGYNYDACKKIFSLLFKDEDLNNIYS